MGVGLRVGGRVRNVSGRRAADPWVLETGTMIGVETQLAGPVVGAQTYLVRYDTRRSIWRWITQLGWYPPVYRELAENLELVAQAGSADSSGTP